MSDYSRINKYSFLKKLILFCLAFSMIFPIFQLNGKIGAVAETELRVVREENSDRFSVISSDRKWLSYPVGKDENVPLEIGNTAKSNLKISYIFQEQKLADPKEYTVDSYSESVSKDDYDIEDLDNGFRITYRFTDIGITIPIIFQISNNRFEASVELSKIKETGETLLTSINLLPYFSAGNSEENGELFVPDGSGALIHFNNGNSQIYDKEVYGAELAAPKKLNSDVSESIKMPVLGLFTENFGVLGIVSDGKEISSIVAQSADPDVGTYNTVSSKLNYRSLYLKEMINDNNASRITKNAQGLKKYTVIYYLITGQNIGIIDLAKCYRNYLVEELKLTKNNANAEFNLNLIGSVDIQANFLGIPYRKQIALTTYKQSQEILKYFEELGIKNISVKYSGWMKDGVSNRKLPSKVTYCGKLGSKKDFKKLNDAVSSNGGILYPDVDLTTYRKGSTGKAVKNAFRETAYQNVYMPSVYATRLDVPKWMILSSDYIFTKSSSFLKSYKKSGYSNISLLSLTDNTYANLDNKHFVSRTETVEYFKKVMESVKKKDILISGENSNDYAFGYLSKIFSAPTNISNEKVMDERVPFYSLVLHGYIQMTAKPLGLSENTYDYLSAVENGYELMFTGMYADSALVKDTAYDKYYSTNYMLWADRANELYKEYYPLLEKISNQCIEDYRKIDDEINAVTYENGVCVYINYGATDKQLGNLTVKAHSFAVSEK